MAGELTLMTVHAHPDDEVLGTGGILARYSGEGIQTVLVTCTNGEQGDGPGGVKPGQPGHDETEVSQLRLTELRDSAAHLGVTHVELLGYRDSGMAGWKANHEPGSFANIPVEQAAGRLAMLMERYRPQVIVTYDERGGYGHPDHIQAHRITVKAADAAGTGIQKLYFTAVARSRIAELARYMRARGSELPDLPADFGTPDEQITAVVDVSRYAECKREALQAHASQGDNLFLLNLPADVQQRAFATEAFVRQFSRVRAPGWESDLFAGLR